MRRKKERTMRKKAWILCTAMIVALAGCSNVSDNNTTDIIQVSSETVTTTEAATEAVTTTENAATTESVTESNIPDSTLQSEGSNIGKTESAATEAKTTKSQLQEGEPSDDSWKEEFEKTLYEEYGVVPDHYEYIGNDVYQVYVKIDGKIVPYVAVNWKTGDFHG